MSWTALFCTWPRGSAVRRESDLPVSRPDGAARLAPSCVTGASLQSGVAYARSARSPSELSGEGAARFTRPAGVRRGSDPTAASEYTSRKFGRACRKLGVSQSMGRVGSCFDNAVSEAFNSVLKVEYVHRHAFRTRTEARIKIATWITDFYNARRLHSVCDFKSPIDYEREYWAGLTMGLAA